MFAGWKLHNTLILCSDPEGDGNTKEIVIEHDLDPDEAAPEVSEKLERTEAEVMKEMQAVENALNNEMRGDVVSTEERFSDVMHAGAT